jgi:hypothetical protein
MSMKMPSARFTAVLAAMLLPTAGCSQSSSAGASDAGGDAVSVGGAAQYGMVFVVDTKMPTGEGGGVSATFQRGNGTACSWRVVGTCNVLRCATGGLPLSNLSAGTISITGGSTPATLMPASDNTYSYSGIVSFSPGANVLFAASGAEVPSWSTSVSFPSPITVTSPAANQSPAIDHTKDFAIAWSGGGSSKVLATVEESVPDRLVEITCLFDAAGGSATIPSAALSDLEPSTTLGSGSGEGDISVYSVGASEVSAGGFPVLAAAGSVAFSALPKIQ